MRVPLRLSHYVERALFPDPTIIYGYKARMVLQVRWRPYVRYSGIAILRPLYLLGT